MTVASGRFTFGVEEEYQIVDPETRALRPEVARVLPRARQLSGGQVETELHQAQIEIGTPVCSSLDDVRAELARLRRTVAAAAEVEGCRIAAAGTHPFSSWHDQRITEKDDYRALGERYGQLAREQLVFGCHVHVCIEDREQAIQVMNHARVWLPPLLALSASSPFWERADTGYASYRTEVFSRWPTAGFPEVFSSRAEFDDVVAQLKVTDSIDEPARLYWYIRPSAKFQTLEFRVADVCTSLADAVMVAGLVRAVARACQAAVERQEAVPPTRPELLRSAAWRAARNGIDADLVDLNAMRSAPARQVVQGLLDFVRPTSEDAEWAELSELVATTFSRGTSASRQRGMQASGGELERVVDWVMAETLRGT